MGVLGVRSKRLPCPRRPGGDQRWSQQEAGTAGGGVASSKTKGKAEFVNFSFDVKVEGKNVARAMELMLHNDKNAPPFPVIQPPVVALGERDGKVRCLVCEKDL